MSKYRQDFCKFSSSKSLFHHSWLKSWHSSNSHRSSKKICIVPFWWISRSPQRFYSNFPFWSFSKFNSYFRKSSCQAYSWKKITSKSIHCNYSCIYNTSIYWSCILISSCWSRYWSRSRARSTSTSRSMRLSNTVISISITVTIISISTSVITSLVCVTKFSI